MSLWLFACLSATIEGNLTPGTGWQGPASHFPPRTHFRSSYDTEVRTTTSSFLTVYSAPVDALLFAGRRKGGN